MALEDRGAQHDKVIVDKYVNPQGNYQMSVLDYVVRPSATPATGPWTLVLPPVAEAKGRFYSIICRNADAVNFITITDRNSDSECWIGNVIMNGKCDRTIFYSDGLAWCNICAYLTPVGTTAPPETTVSPTTSP